VSARTPDGVVEAIEAPGKTFCLGVQFHPERLIKRDILFLKIFQAFKNEVIRYKKSKEMTG